MNMIETTLINDPAAWDQALLQLPRPHILESWLWGQTKAQTGWQARRLLWQDGPDRKPVAAAAVQVRRLGGLPRLPLIRAAVAYVPKGPILDWDNAGLVEAVLARLEQEARRSGSIFLKIDPEVSPETQTGQAVCAALARRGWRPSAEQIQFRNTMVNDLTASEETILARMKPKWRYNIRLAERKGVTVRCGTAADLPVFYAMYVETGQRDGFLVRPYPYYCTIWQNFLDQNLAHLLLAEVEGQPVAGLILFRFGPTAWYFYGASTAQARPLMPNYALQWAALCWAKAAGCTRYDWWGAPDVLAETDPMWGVYRFKEGFGGEFTPSIGAYDYPTSRLLYWLYATGMPRLLEIARRRHRVSVPVAGGQGMDPNRLQERDVLPDDSGN